MKLFSDEHVKIATEGMREYFEARHEYLKRRMKKNEQHRG